MAKVIVGLAVSLDAYIEGPNGEYDWCFTDQDYGMTEFLQNTSGIFFGRKSYEMLLNGSNGTNPFASIPAYVFSNTLTSAYPGTTLISGDVKKKVADLLAGQHGNYWFFGGADLLRAFLAEQLIDEIGMAIHPLLLGDGKPLFQKAKERTALELVDVKTYSSGLVYVTYRVLKTS